MLPSVRMFRGPGLGPADVWGPSSTAPLVPMLMPTTRQHAHPEAALMKTFITLALIIAAAHCVWAITTPKVNHYFLDSKISDMAAQGRLYNQAEMLKEIMRIVDERNIPIEAKEIRFKRDGKKMKISVAYEQTVTVPFYSKTYAFKSEHTGIYDPKR
jgi:hypothetical protein